MPHHTKEKQSVMIMYELRIRDLRENRDLTQKELADYLGVHQTTYSDYELGRLNVPVAQLHRLADFTASAWTTFLGRTKRKTPYPK